ncbi:MAG: DUF4150 domain-containing protein [Gammaproteobacteria bacterium]|nr:DUF4150 domain-containing protein [Gammaproteobacteria bacterium]
MLVNCSMGGMNMAMPDICKTPAPPLPFIPVPYPNIAVGAMAIPTQFTVLTMGMPAHNLLTMVPLSNGDNGGVMGGLVSQLMMGPSRHIRGSFKLLLGAMPATRLLDQAGQNGVMPNMVGTTIVPAQVKVIALA